MKRVFLVFALAATAVLAGPSAAHAATTLGETFVPNSCAEETYIQTADPGSRYTVPFDGVITRWSYQSDATPPPQVRFKVGRVAPGADLSMDVDVTIVGQSALETPAPSSLNTYATRIPVTAGDKIGEYITDDCSRNDPAYTDHYCCEDVQPGTTSLFTRETFQQDISAVLEADSDRDAFGDESQDKCVGTAGTFNGCPSTVAIKRLKQKGTKPKLKVTATVPGAGTLSAGSQGDPSLAAAAAKTLKPVTRILTLTSRQQVTLTLKLTKSAKRKLGDKGRLKAKVKVVYVPAGGPAAAAKDKAKLKAKP